MGPTGSGMSVPSIQPLLNPATNAPGAEWYASTHTNGRTKLENGVWNNWLPRIGFAYQLNNKTTLRGGFGMYDFTWNVDYYASCCLGAATAYSGNETDSTGNVRQWWFSPRPGTPTIRVRRAPLSTRFMDSCQLPRRHTTGNR